VDELEIQGKKYISSKRASELTGYAKDYVGQLARAGKVPGTRVGRAWYVEESALLSHQGQEEASLALQSEPREVLSPIQMPRAYISPATLKAIGYGASLPETWTPPTYFRDNGDLVPRIEKYALLEPQKRALPEGSIRVRVIRKEDIVEIKEEEPQKQKMALEKASVVEKAKEVRRTFNPGHKTLSLGALTAALGIFLFFSAGFVLSSHFTLRESNGANAANLILGFEYARDTLMKFPPFVMGLNSVQFFFSTLQASFSDFFNQGLKFVIWLVHLV
jgi:hypothetical protein